MRSVGQGCHEEKCSLTNLCSTHFLEKLDIHISAKSISLNSVDLSGYAIV